jgi:hypothetical protein
LSGVKRIVIDVMQPFRRLDSVGFFTALLCFVAWLQWGTLEKTDETLRAAQRPWIRYEGIEILEPLSYGDGVAKTRVKIHLKNSGNSPALGVITSIKLVMNNLTSRREQEALCEPMKKPRVGLHDEGFVSFPGPEPVAEEQEISVPYPLFFGGGPPVNFFTIISCVTYRFSFGHGDFHQTGAIFNLLTTKPPTVKFNPSEAHIMRLGIDPRLGNIQPSDLQIAVWHIGSYAD